VQKAEPLPDFTEALCRAGIRYYEPGGSYFLWCDYSGISDEDDTVFNESFAAYWKQQTGEDIFAAVEQRLARPIGMQDFRASNGKYVFGRVSMHPAYHMDISARDLARFGLLYLRQGNWNGRAVVPAAWVRESTRPIAAARPGVGYGYMWWAATREEQMSVRVGLGAYSARGNDGQFVFVLPAHDLVIVVLHSQHVLDREVGQLLRKIMEASPGRGSR